MSQKSFHSSWAFCLIHKFDKYVYSTSSFKPIMKTFNNSQLKTSTHGALLLISSPNDIDLLILSNMSPQVICANLMGIYLKIVFRLTHRAVVLDFCQRPAWNWEALLATGNPPFKACHGNSPTEVLARDNWRLAWKAVSQSSKFYLTYPCWLSFCGVLNGLI